MAELVTWTVYDHPSDFPDGFIARRWVVSEVGVEASESAVRAVSLDALRDFLVSLGLTCIPRSPGDEPQIVETWL